MKAKKIIQDALYDIGIEIGKDLIVLNDDFYPRVLRDHSIGLGEAYVDGWWDAPDLNDLFRRIIPKVSVLKKRLQFNLPIIAYLVAGRLFNRQKKQRSKHDIQYHYDIGNELYEGMLDKNLVYTCAYFKDPDWTLERAQMEKVDLVYRKLHIPERFQAGERLRVLDIGCGWGYGLIHGAERYGIEGVGITLSAEQVKLGRERARGLPVELRLQDYRDIPKGEMFDAIFSLGMFEHVGRYNYRRFMKTVARHLKPDGLFLLHTIGGTENGPVDPWTNKYIFPGAYIPSHAEIARATDKLFIQHDFQNFGLYYPLTVKEWAKRFDHNWNKIKKSRPEFYTERFYRLWKFYLNVAPTVFYNSRSQLWQIVYSRSPLERVYEAVR